MSDSALHYVRVLFEALVVYQEQRSSVLDDEEPDVEEDAAEQRRLLRPSAGEQQPQVHNIELKEKGRGAG